MGENVIWSVEIDNGKFKAWVESSESHKGILYVESSDKSKKFSQEVAISYGAMFGPDVDDVNAWGQAALNYIDSL